MVKNNYVPFVNMVKKMVNKSKQVGTKQSVGLQSHYVLHILEEIVSWHILSMEYQQHTKK